MSESIKNIPQLAIDELVDLIGEKTQAKLFKFILIDVPQTKESIELYIRKLINNHLLSQDSVIDVFEIKSNVYRRRQLTKKNWFKQLKKEVSENKPNPIQAELDILMKVIDRKGLDDKIKNVLSFENPDQYIQAQLNDIEKWANDPSTKITDFPYLESKRTYQIKKALENDILYIICDFLQDKPTYWYSLRTEEWIDNPLFADGREILCNH